MEKETRLSFIVGYYSHVIQHTQQFKSKRNLLLQDITIKYGQTNKCFDTHKPIQSNNKSNQDAFLGIY